MIRIFAFLFAAVLAGLGVALDYSLAAKSHGTGYAFADHVLARFGQIAALAGHDPAATGAAPAALASAAPAAVPAVTAARAAPDAPRGGGLAGLVVAGMLAGARAAAAGTTGSAPGGIPSLLPSVAGLLTGSMGPADAAMPAAADDSAASEDLVDTGADLAALGDGSSAAPAAAVPAAPKAAGGLLKPVGHLMDKACVLRAGVKVCGAGN